MLIMLLQHLVLVKQPRHQSERALRWNTTSLGHSTNEGKVEHIGAIITVLTLLLHEDKLHNMKIEYTVRVLL